MPMPMGALVIHDPCLLLWLLFLHVSLFASLRLCSHSSSSMTHTKWRQWLSIEHRMPRHNRITTLFLLLFWMCDAAGADRDTGVCFLSTMLRKMVYGRPHTPVFPSTLDAQWSQRHANFIYRMCAYFSVDIILEKLQRKSQSLYYICAWFMHLIRFDFVENRNES